MSHTTRMNSTLPALALALSLAACDAPKETPAAASATSAPAPSATVAAKPSASAAKPAGPKPSHPCPEGTKGEGTRDKPCEASGAARAMTVQWTGKIADKGPSFRVTNTTKLEILYGFIAIYFYDKAGKQIEIGEGDKAKKYLSCGGNIFAGPMKAGEKATIYFSCAKKKHVPEGAVAIEAELRTVGFTGKDGRKADTFWRNNDLVPKDRPKGGVK